MLHPARIAVLVLAALAASLAGCYAETPVGYAETTGAPVDIETYPSVIYEGQPVYYYGDHWWHREGGRWTYYRTEPAELQAQRDMIRRAPRQVRVAPRAEPPRVQGYDEHP
jgi:hypothetical protein